MTCVCCAWKWRGWASRRPESVAAGILPAAEPGFQPGGKGVDCTGCQENSRAAVKLAAVPGGRDVTLYVREHFWSDLSPKVVPRVTPTFPTDAKGSAAYAQEGHATPKGPSIWPMLIEKAYAILNGGYSEIEGGFGSDALEALTGKSSKTRSRSRGSSRRRMGSRSPSWSFWRRCRSPAGTSFS